MDSVPSCYSAYEDSAAAARRAAQDRWRNDRNRLNRTRHELATAAADLYPDADRVEGTRLLSRSNWLPPEPVALETLRLRLVPGTHSAAITGRGQADHLLPPGDPPRLTYRSYAEALGVLARPVVFENRPAFRLLAADLTASTPSMRFGLGAYFDGIDVGEAAAHELATREPGAAVSLAELPFRRLVGDPCRLDRRPAIAAVSTLTLRVDRSRGTATFLLHRRDPTRVAHGGGLCHVLPVGVFQPLGESPADLAEDFDLWRCIVREFSEELLSQPENYSRRAGFRYDTWPFFAAIDQIRRAGFARVHCLGLGVDPLTFATDILTVASIDANSFDDLFSELTQSNAEGSLIRRPGSSGIPFEESAVAALLRDDCPMQAAGAAALRLALRSRDYLLSWQ